MKFCKFCNNMLYISTDPEKRMIYLCNTCGDSQVVNTTSESVCVIDDNKIDDNILFNQYINKYIKYDPSLPRVNNIECPNKDCTRQPEEEVETIYLKYDFANMKYVYYCCYCEHFWRTIEK